MAAQMPRSCPGSAPSGLGAVPAVDHQGGNGAEEIRSLGGAWLPRCPRASASICTVPSVHNCHMSTVREGLGFTRGSSSQCPEPTLKFFSLSFLNGLCI